MAIFKLTNDAAARFIEAPEIYANLQLGKLSSAEIPCLVVGAEIAVVLDADLPRQLEEFWHSTWEKFRGADNLDAVIPAYEAWIAKQTAIAAEPIDDSSRNFAAVLGGSSASAPPPPPNRPNLVPGGPPISAAPPGHLAFTTVTRAKEIFYRFEAWPTSKRLLNGPPPTIALGTYASPKSEEHLIPTGFAAVARCALPSFFPAVFKYEIVPASRQPMRCGAVVPMFGQSGGGVEVMFPNATQAQQGFARSIIPPF